MTMDHILPISLGGEEFEQSNLQLLCGPCNKVKTKQDMANIGKQRKVEKVLIKGQAVLPKFNSQSRGRSSDAVRTTPE